MNRRHFLKGSATVLPAAAALEVLGGSQTLAQGAQFRDDNDILNYALVLEYFLSQFYRESSGLISGKEARYVSEVAADENGHVAAITQTIQKLGGKPVPTPAINLGNALASRMTFLRAFHRFENLFAGAYLGASRYVTNPEILQAVVGIYGVEERHAAIAGELLGLGAEPGVYTGATGKAIDRAEVIRVVKPYIAGAKSRAAEAAITR